MTSRAKRRANQRNAQHSTGPRTDEGKQRSSQNALKHGLRSKHPLIPGEDPADYQRKLEMLRADLRPLNALEDDIVEQIADTSWRLKRLSRIEAAVESYYIQKTAGKQDNAGNDDDYILGNALTDYRRIGDLVTLSRYEAQLSRRYHRLTKELRDLRKSREDTFFRNRPLEERDREERDYQKQRASGEHDQPIEPSHSTQLPIKPITSAESATPPSNPNSGSDQDLRQTAADITGHPGQTEVSNS